MRIVRINNSSNCYNLSPLKGWENEVLSPIKRKKVVYNENDGINGTRPVISNRMVDKRDFSISFYIKCEGEYERYAQLQEIEQCLTAGMNNTGINELAVEIGNKIVTLHVLMESMDKYEGMGSNRAIVAIKFVEINPKNRLVV